MHRIQHMHGIQCIEYKKCNFHKFGKLDIFTFFVLSDSLILETHGQKEQHDMLNALHTIQYYNTLK